MLRFKVSDLFAKKKQGEKLASLSCYSYPIAKIADEYMDIILVGDTVGMVLYGMDSTQEVSLNMMLEHGRAVSKACNRSFIVVDMPYGSYEKDKKVALENAQKIIEYTGADAVKLEGGEEIAETIKLLSENQIEVVGHIGLLPQAITDKSLYKVRGKNTEEVDKLKRDFNAVKQAGCKIIVFECIYKDIADLLCQDKEVITIGIGASASCDGQIMVFPDLFGETVKVAKFVKKYFNSESHINKALATYASEVKMSVFPALENIYNKK